MVTSKPDGAAGDNTTSGSLVVPLRVSPAGGLVPLPDSQAAPAPKSLIPTDGGLVVDPSGRFLLLYSTIPSLIARYRIGPDGSLASLGVTPTNGQPVALTFGPGGRTVYALNRYYNSVSTFRLDNGGGLTKVGLDTPNGGPFVAGFALANAPTPQVWGPAAGGVEVSARLEREVFTLDAPVVLTVVLRNVTSHSIGLGSVGADMPSFHLTVTGPRRQSWGALGPGGEPATEVIPFLSAGQDLLGAPSPSGAPLVLPPGAQRQYRLVLSRIADLSVAGNYTVRVSRTLPGVVAAVAPPLHLRIDNLYDGLSIYSPEWRPDLRSAEHAVEIL
jgi:hypothetical protein